MMKVSKRRMLTTALVSWVYLVTAGNQGCAGSGGGGGSGASTHPPPPPGAPAPCYLHDAFESTTDLAIDGQDDDETPSCIETTSTAEISDAVKDWGDRTSGGVGIHLKGVTVHMSNVANGNTATRLSGTVRIALKNDASRFVESQAFNLPVDSNGEITVELSESQADDLLAQALADAQTEFDVTVNGCVDNVPAHLTAQVNASFAMVVGAPRGTSRCLNE